MIKKLGLSFLLCAITLQAKSGVDIGKLIQPSFSKKSQVTKRQFNLNTKQIKVLQNKAKAKLDSNIVRLYTVKSGNLVEGYGVLVIKIVRSKMAALLYIIDTQEKIKSIEIVAFKEPHEYKPKKSWQSLFKGKSKEDNLFAGKGLPTISGATLSARAIADASRIALAVVEMYK